MKNAVLFIVNPIAGPRKNKSHIIKAIQSRSHFLKYEIYETRRRGDATRAARDAVQQGFQVVVAVGGDGTVNEVASALVHTDVALGIIPRGSGNGLARALEIPFSTADALEVIYQSGRKIIDIGKAADRYFCVVAGVGFDAQVSQAFDQSQLRGLMSYVWVIVKELKHYSPQACEMLVDGKHVTCYPFLVTVANAPQYGNGAIIAPHAKMDDGYFDLCVVKEMAFLQKLVAAPRLFLGNIDKHPGVCYYKMKQVEFLATPPIRYHVDGEPVRCDEPLRIEVLPQALKVIVPYATKS